MAARTVRLAELEANFTSAVEQEKLAALKEFAYGAGHEINNPLANISARAQTLLKDEHDPERRQKLAAINTQAFRAHEMIADLMLFAQPPEWKSQRVAIGPLVAELESAWRRQAAEQQTTLNVRIADASLAAWADRSALAVALRALVANALEALGRGGTIELAVTPTRLTKEHGSQNADCRGRPILPSPCDHSLPRSDAVAICVCATTGRASMPRCGRAFSIRSSPAARRVAGWASACPNAGASRRRLVDESTWPVARRRARPSRWFCRWPPRVTVDRGSRVAGVLHIAQASRTPSSRRCARGIAAANKSCPLWAYAGQRLPGGPVLLLK